MVRAVADTHAVVWYVYNDSRLSTRAGVRFDEATALGQRIAISTISLAEMVYLVEKRRIDTTALDRVIALLDLDELLVESPVQRATILAMKTIDRSKVPDFPDRIIAATSLQLGVPLISGEGRIRASGVPTVW